MNYIQQDIKARALGAVAFHDEYVTRNTYGGRENWHFARYYFNAEGTELAYFIPDMLPFNGADHLSVHPSPREWGNHLPKVLVRL